LDVCSLPPPDGCAIAMSAITQSTINSIKKATHKALGVFSNQKNIRLSQLLKELCIEKLIETKQHVKFPTAAMVNALIFGNIKEIKSQSELANYLRNNRKDASNLGFYTADCGTPDQRSINYFENGLDDKTKAIINFTSAFIKSVLGKSDFIVDDKPFKVVGSTAKRKPSLECRKRRMTRKLSRLLKRKAYPLVPLEVPRHTHYIKRDYLDVLANASLKRQFTEGGAKSCLNLKTRLMGIEDFEGTDRYSPTGETVLSLIKKMDTEKIKTMSDKMFDVSWEICKSKKPLERRICDLGIDNTDYPNYGDENHYFITKMEPPGKGTENCQKFSDSVILEFGERFTLKSIQNTVFSRREKIVRELIEDAKKKIIIRRIFLDRGFFSSQVMKVLREEGANWIMPVKENSKITKIIDSHPIGEIIEGYIMGKEQEKFNFIIIKKEKIKKREKRKKMAFATNMPMPDEATGYRMVEDYRKRWGVETSFRKTKEILVRTTSNNPSVRLLYPLLSVIFYNFWIMVDILVSEKLFGGVSKIHRVELQFFIELFVMEGVT